MSKACSINREECVAEARYYGENEDWEALCSRVAHAVSAVEDDKELWYRNFYNIIMDKKFIPGGRILRNTGRVNRNLLNCFVIPIGDNIESIGSCIKDSLITWASGGGVGINFSTLRPRGTDIKGKGGNSSGLVSFLEAIDAVASTIESGGQRRAACIAIVDVSHPEVEEFIDAKLKHGLLKHFNVSVAINNEFLETVERGNSWELKFGHKTYKTVDAIKLWNKILDNMISSAEPGLINMDKLVRSNSYYFAPIISTNPCGELPLPAYGSCDLGSIVLSKFVTEGGSTKWTDLEEAILVAVRFLDDVIDVTSFPIPEMRSVAEEGRRIGLGVMGLADYLFKKQIRYGSEKALLEIEHLFKFIRDSAYRASVELAKEKKPFPKFDAVDYGKASFVRKLPAKLRKDIKEFGIRNVSLLTCAPTGTTSQVAGVNGGIEPLFSKAYIREDKVGQDVFVNGIYADCLTKKQKVPDWLVDSYDLTPEEHFEAQAFIQKYIDGSISKTINLPAKTTVKELSNWLLEYMYELKGVTVYVDKSREEQVLYPMDRTSTLAWLSNRNSEEE